MLEHLWTLLGCLSALAALACSQSVFQWAAHDLGTMPSLEDSFPLA